MSNGLLYVAVVLLWGSTWLAISFQVGDASPSVSVAYRFAIAAALLFAVCIVMGRRLAFGLRDHGLFAGLGLCLFSVNFILVYAAELRIGSAMTAIVFASLVWVNMLLAVILFRARIELRGIVGSVIGMTGLAIVCWPDVRAAGADGAVLAGVLLGLVGTVVASVGNMISQAAQAKGLPIVESSAWGMLYGAVLSGIIAALAGASFELPPGPGYLLSLLYLAVFGSIAGFGAYLTLLGRIGAHRAGYATVATPVVAMLLAMGFEGFEPGPAEVIGMLLVLAGNLLTLWRRHVLPGARSRASRRVSGAVPGATEAA